MIERALHFLSASWASGLEILILASVLYFAYRNLHRTTGARIFIGFALVFLTITFVSQLLHLEVIGWLLRSVSVFLAIALVVIFQPELRRVLTDLGSHRFFAPAFQRHETVGDISEAVFDLSGKGFGALLAIERDISLGPFIETGVALDAQFSKELILTIFHPKTVLHDGGVILRNDRVVAAACIFPLTQREDFDRTLGLRHRAALGITEESDALVIVVSEETGQISVCHGGGLERNLKPEQLEAILTRFLTNEPDPETSPARLEGQTRLSDSREHSLVPHPTEPAR